LPDRYHWISTPDRSFFHLTFAAALRSAAARTPEGDQNVPAAVMQLRKQHIKNVFTILMVSNGIPMFCGNDEFMNTQQGNNNSWNQDNERTWLDW
jgi:pullulanase/glycogen debranching enzyme